MALRVPSLVAHRLRTNPAAGRPGGDRLDPMYPSDIRLGCLDTGVKKPLRKLALLGLRLERPFNSRGAAHRFSWQDGW
jgi:hypothetical protein